MPESEADSAWWFVSYPGEGVLPSAERFSELAGCDRPEGGVSRQDFDATLDHLGNVQPWMDRGQQKSARGFARLQDLFHRRSATPSTAARPAPPRSQSTFWGWTKTASRGS